MGLFSSLFGRSTPAPALYTGRLLAATDVWALLPNRYSAVLGKAQYAEANSAALLGLAQATRDDLWKNSYVASWEPQATCTVFAARLALDAQLKFWGAARLDLNLSKLVLGYALGEVWFHPDGAAAGQNHAICLALTERGPLYIDPQIPDRYRPLSPDELNSATCRFL